MWLLGYPGWLLGCCYVITRVLRVVAKVFWLVARMLICGCYGSRGGC